MLPMPVNALLMSLARVCIATTAAKATRARINAYSTRPCPASSLWRRLRDFRIRVFILFSLGVWKCYAVLELLVGLNLRVLHRYKWLRSKDKSNPLGLLWLRDVGAQDG